MEKKKVIYIAGPITGVKRYWEAFERAEDELLALGYIPLSPSRLPVGLSEQQYMGISLATITVADAVLFLPGWEHSKGAMMEMQFCKFTNKPTYTDPRLIGEMEE